MRFLANMGISPRTVSFLRSLGHEAVRLNEVGLERSQDSEVVARATERHEVILTFDLDYPILLALQPERRTSAILFRTMNADPVWINLRLEDCLSGGIQALKEGAILVVEDDRMRVRRLADL